MACNGYDKVWELASGELVQLDDARGATLRVTRGLLWITLQDDLRDVVLAAGDSFTIDRDGLTLAEAQDATVACVRAWRGNEIRSSERRPQLAERVTGWLTSIGAADSDRRFAPYY
jgi:hypothetical protein